MVTYLNKRFADKDAYLKYVRTAVDARLKGRPVCVTLWDREVDRKFKPVMNERDLNEIIDVIVHDTFYHDTEYLERHYA